MSTPPEPRAQALADTIRRALRVLGSQPTPASDAHAMLAAARLVYERVRRAGIETQWFTDESGAPLVTAGRGPVAVVTYLDDSHPALDGHSGFPPDFDSGVVRGSGVERKAGVVAALAPLLHNPALASDLTVIVETDRHRGSNALECWLEQEQVRFTRAIWEITDLPLLPPIIVRAATGTLIVEINLQSSRNRVESVYGSVLPDLGFTLAQRVASLKTSDEEVRLPGFYDGIMSPDESEFDSLVGVAPGVSAWLRQIANEERNLSTSHMTLGMFCAPALIVRNLELESSERHLPTSATAVLEFQLLPGQSSEAVIESLRSHVADLPFAATVRPRLVRQPVIASTELGLPEGVPVIPIAPGSSPASLFATRNIPTLGYALVGRTVDRDQRGLSLDVIERGSEMLLSIVNPGGSSHL